MGPGLVVMLADTDVGSIITAAQSGVQWGYRLLLLQLLLMPVLYIVQELTVRLGIFTGKGHGELIRSTFGGAWAWVSVCGLGVATVGALITEFSGVAGVGELFGVPRAISLTLATALSARRGADRKLSARRARRHRARPVRAAPFSWWRGARIRRLGAGSGLVRMPVRNSAYLYLLPPTSAR